ncbi:hypothetical protein SAMN04487911_102203 [Arenibacter nanhaiticus]|uniref:Uncharacterized protein n=1 Tax=Arenibacter nanhaiticus TaxID=558155 RepID=A0A1M6BHW5_9FLAO|nr:hypothetical protein SAMN04487911_102203 [Arenibacter nanhaiticus]
MVKNVVIINNNYWGEVMFLFLLDAMEEYWLRQKRNYNRRNLSFPFYNAKTYVWLIFKSTQIKKALPNGGASIF